MLGRSPRKASKSITDRLQRFKVYAVPSLCLSCNVIKLNSGPFRCTDYIIPFLTGL